jgi:hypothetical protein
MTASTLREWIVESINRIVSGETFTRGDFDAQPQSGEEEIISTSGIFSSDREPAHFAWLALQWWINDDDIRAKDPEYGEMRKRQLQCFLEQLERRSASR